jgi:hypothetical protein
MITRNTLIRGSMREYHFEHHGGEVAVSNAVFFFPATDTMQDMRSTSLAGTGQVGQRER